MTLTDASWLYCPSHVHAKLLHPYHKAIKAGKVFSLTIFAQALFEKEPSRGFQGGIERQCPG